MFWYFLFWDVICEKSEINREKKTKPLGSMQFPYLFLDFFFFWDPVAVSLVMRCRWLPCDLWKLMAERFWCGVAWAWAVWDLMCMCDVWKFERMLDMEWCFVNCLFLCPYFLCSLQRSNICKNWFSFFAKDVISESLVVVVLRVNSSKAEKRVCLASDPSFSLIAWAKCFIQAVDPPFSACLKCKESNSVLLVIDSKMLWLLKEILLGQNFQE